MKLIKLYDADYTNLMNSFIHDELGLKNTETSDGTGDLNGYWDRNWVDD